MSASFQPDLIRLINHNDFSIYRGYAATASELDTSVRHAARGSADRPAHPGRPRSAPARDEHQLLCATDENDRPDSADLNRKTGFFPYQDEGKIDLRLGCAKDDGLHFKVKLEPAGDENAETFFRATKVDGAPMLAPQH